MVVQLPRDEVRRTAGVMCTPDGKCRVEIVYYRGSREPWYRVVHDDRVLDHLTIGMVVEVLEAAGLSMADLAESA